MPSRRHKRQTGPVYLAMDFIFDCYCFLFDMSGVLDATFLAGTATIVWQRGDIFDGFHLEASRFKGRDGTLATTARSLDLHFYVLDSKFLSLFGSLLGSTLTGKRGALAAPLETTRAGTCPTERVSLGVGDRHGGVVKRRFDVGKRDGHVAPDGLLFYFACLNLLGHW